jgi:HEAT repeat protein
MNLKGVGTDDLVEILVEIGDARAVEPLLGVFKEVAPTAGTQTKIVEFFAHIGAKEAANGLLPYLDDSYSPTRSAAAYGLGLLGVEDTRSSLVNALEKYRSSVTRALRGARTDFARSLVEESEARRKAGGPDTSAMDDQQMLDILNRLCDAYMENDVAAIERLELLATDIGEELDRRGGLSEMRRVFHQLDRSGNTRALEGHWGGIGEWQG